VETRTETQSQITDQNIIAVRISRDTQMAAGASLVARIAAQDQLTSSLSDLTILSDAKSGTPRHARQIQHHHFNPHAQCK
jgi:hypothetical protein